MIEEVLEEGFDDLVVGKETAAVTAAAMTSYVNGRRDNVYCLRKERNKTEKLSRNSFKNQI